MGKLICQGKIYSPLDYDLEKDFESEIVNNSKEIFGPESLYIDVKKKIGKDKIVSIPDGYLIDFSFISSPRLYIIENELAKHDPYRHIGQQLLKFAISYKESGRKIKRFLLKKILEEKASKSFVTKRLSKAGFRNIDAFLEAIIFDKPVAVIVVIDESTSDLENVLAQLTMDADILEFKTFVEGDERIHYFTPFQQEIREPGPGISPEEFDTVVVPAREETFNNVFLGEDCWYEIVISASMIDRIKYIAAYQVAPISAITHYAEVSNIEKYKDTNKYVVRFKDKAKKIGPVKLPKESKGIAPMARRYTSFKKLAKAKTLKDIF